MANITIRQYPYSITASENNRGNLGIAGSTNPRRIDDIQREKMAQDAQQFLNLANAITTVNVESSTSVLRLDTIESNGWVTENRIADDAVTRSKIEDGAVFGVHLSLNAYGSIENYINSQNALTANALAPNAVGRSELASEAVDTPQLARGAVTSTRLDVGDVNRFVMLPNRDAYDAIANKNLTTLYMWGT